MKTDCTPAWMMSSWPAREHDGDAHREDDDDRHLPRPVAEREDDDVADEHADGDAHGHLDDPTQPLPVGEARGRGSR